MVVPNFKVVCLEETQYYEDKELVEKVGNEWDPHAGDCESVETVAVDEQVSHLVQNPRVGVHASVVALSFTVGAVTCGVRL